MMTDPYTVRLWVERLEALVNEADEWDADNRRRAIDTLRDEIRVLQLKDMM